MQHVSNMLLDCVIFCRVDELFNELRINTTSNALEYIVFFTWALKTWNLISSYVIFNVSQTLKHPCLTSSWILCLYMHLQKIVHYYKHVFLPLRTSTKIEMSGLNLIKTITPSLSTLSHGCWWTISTINPPQFHPIM